MTAGQLSSESDSAESLIVGDPADSHVGAVLAAVETLGGRPPLVFDAPGLVRDGFGASPYAFEFRGRSCALDRCRGWLRRYAPPMWGAGTVLGSLEAVTQRAFLALVASMSRLGDVEWLTSLDAMLAAEDRLLQLERAHQTGARVPRWLVTSDVSRVASDLGEPFVAKPLTNGYFLAEDGPRAVYAELVDRRLLAGASLGAAPFVFQEHVVALDHLRVVTVGRDAWACRIAAKGRPLDWRVQDEAHFAWEVLDDAEVCASALTVAAQFGIGYSSQDWLRDDRGLVFLDLNPGGQWLFLPPEASEPVTRAIAKHLCG
jgi:hypothetical protein